MLLLSCLLLVAVLAVVLLSAGDGGDDTTPGGPRKDATATGVPAGSSAALKDGRVRIRLEGVKGDTPYAAWLFNSILDARRLGPVKPNQTVTSAFPKDASRFRLLDLSRQPGGGTRHSGLSVRRAAVADLREGKAVALRAPAPR